MNKILKEVIEHAETWPQEDQEELAEYAREIEARRTRIYLMSDDERTAVGKGLAEAGCRQFVSEEAVYESDKPQEMKAATRLRSHTERELYARFATVPDPRDQNVSRRQNAPRAERVDEVEQLQR